MELPTIIYIRLQCNDRKTKYLYVLKMNIHDMFSSLFFKLFDYQMCIKIYFVDSEIFQHIRSAR